MQIAVWDTYVTRKDGSVMHFDIMVPASMSDEDTVYGYGRSYLRTKGEEGQPLAAEECRFCHVETAKPQWQADIERQGYYIYEMQNCS